MFGQWFSESSAVYPWPGATEQDWREWESGDPTALIPTMANTAPSGLFALELDTALKDDLTAFSAADLVDAASGFEKLAAWAIAQQARVLAEFDRRPTDDTLAPATTREPRAFASDEVALALTLAPRVGAERLAHARRLDGVLRPTRDALAAGRICSGRARLVCRMLTDHDDEVAATVQARVLPAAGKQTWSQLRAAITKALLAVVPDQADRHRVAQRRRSVELYPGQDGMASLVTTLSATDATACFGWLTRLARGIQPDTHPDTDTRSQPGSMDRRRADVLVALLTGRLIATRAHPEDHTTVDWPEDGHTHPTHHSKTTATSATTASGTTDTITTTGAPTAIATTGATGLTAEGTSGFLHAAPVNALRPLIQIVVPITTLMGISDEPAELTGYGPIPAHLARKIAADPASTWQRLLTDPASGQLLDIGRTRYRPPPGMAAFVRARDGACRHPTCRRTATACELDHVTEWQHGGRTSEDNLCALCARHHDLKEHHGWHVVLHEDRTVEWTTPTGHSYTSAPVDHRIPARSVAAATTGTEPPAPGIAELLSPPASEDGAAPF
jgi:hypothetical protein